MKNNKDYNLSQSLIDTVRGVGISEAKGSKYSESGHIGTAELTTAQMKKHGIPAHKKEVASYKCEVGSRRISFAFEARSNRFCSKESD